MCLGVGVMVICMLGGAGQKTYSVCVCERFTVQDQWVLLSMQGYIRCHQTPHLGLRVVDADVHRLLLVSSLRDSVWEGAVVNTLSSHDG